MGALLLSCIILGLGMAAATPVNNADSLKAVSGTANTFSINFLKNVSKIQPGNLICSPLSVDMVLAMLSFGAEGKTLQQLRSGLHMRDDETVTKSGYKSLINEFNNEPNVDLKLANKLFTSERFEVKPDYLNTVEDVFDSEVQRLDFENSDEAANSINNWSKQQTNDRIKEIVEPNDFDGNTLMVLANAIYFKGQWADKFDPESTSDMVFYLDKYSTKQVPTMYKFAEFNSGHVEGVDAQFIELPYKGNEFSLVIILPYDIDGLKDLMQKIHEVNMAKILNRGAKEEVELFLPKFKIESSIDLKPILIKMGMGDMFKSSANFASMSDAPLAVSKATQKAFIEVDEEGSEAAAVTQIQVVRASLPIEFRVDRPFIATIVKLDLNQYGAVQNYVTVFYAMITNP